MDMTNLQNEVEHLRAVCARQDDELADIKCLCDERLNSLDDLSAAYDALRAELADNLFHGIVVAASIEISRLKAIIEQMLAETGHGGNEKCGDNRLTPETIARAKGAI